MAVRDRRGSKESTLASADLDSERPLWIHQIRHPPLKRRYANLGLRRGCRVLLLRRTSDGVHLRLSNGREVHLPIEHAREIGVLQIVSTSGSTVSGREPASIGYREQESVYWIGTDPASLRPEIRKRQGAGVGLDPSRVGSDAE